MSGFKMEIALNHKKIDDNGYVIDDAYKSIDDLMSQYKIPTISQGIYIGTGASTDFSYFGLCILSIKKSWLQPFIEKWILETPEGVEDLVKHYSLAG